MILRAVSTAMNAGAFALIDSTIEFWLAPATTDTEAKSPVQPLMPAAGMSAPKASPKAADPTMRGAIA